MTVITNECQMLYYPLRFHFWINIKPLTINGILGQSNITDPCQNNLYIFCPYAQCQFVFQKIDTHLLPTKLRRMLIVCCITSAYVTEYYPQRIFEWLYSFIMCIYSQHNGNTEMSIFCDNIPFQPVVVLIDKARCSFLSDQSLYHQWWSHSLYYWEGTLNGLDQKKKYYVSRFDAQQYKPRALGCIYIQNKTRHVLEEAWYGYYVCLFA